MPKNGEETIANHISSKGLAAPMTRIDSRIVRMVLLLAGAAGLLFGALRNAPVLAAGLAQSAPPAAEEARYALPSYWQGAATVSIDELSDVAPPLQVVDASGNFQFSYIPAEDGDVIRILPDSAADAPSRFLRLAWPLSLDDVDPALPAGQVVVLAAQARAFSPPDGVALAIREYDGEAWTSSSARMDQVQWTYYAVSRALSADAVAVELGIEWALADANAWIELRNLTVTILPVAEEEATDLSPTDTPTPATTPTPLATRAAATPTRWQRLRLLRVRRNLLLLRSKVRLKPPRKSPA